MVTIYAVVGTKGGVGKTVVSWHVLTAILTKLGRNFKIFEIDDSNDSNVYAQSSIIRGNTKNVKTYDPNIIAEIMFETLTGGEDIVIDAGGSGDTLRVIDIIKRLGDVKVVWFIPINQNYRQLHNAIQTYQKIDDPKNTFFILNGCRDFDKLYAEFIFYYGNESRNIKSVKNALQIEREFVIPYSLFFELAEIDNLTIYDLARLSQETDKETAKQLLREQFSDNYHAFIKAYNDYINSEDAAIVLQQIYDSFLPFFVENTPIEQKRTKVK